MKKIIVCIFVCSCFLLGISLFNPSVFAQEDIQSLKRQVEILNKKVAELEAEKSRKSLAPPNNLQGFEENSWDPFAEMDRLQEQMNQMFQDPFGAQLHRDQSMIQHHEFQEPDFNLEETDVGYLIKFNTAGLDRKKIDIQINENSLTLSGESSRETEESNPQAVMRSRSFGKFLKTIPLPVDADIQKLKTEQKGEVLEITIPKKKINS
ncbi:MAG TPA: hypothetical protein DD723_06085 [Candidatus Omnitrophica bacterium]|nr:MAG: hypothetical protein A2Z81_06690 [Omnitrophica WOR_2 bacterium GWA2_45_18]HBR15094.1 hypothetical protein [Candidatus Omnitrophota bacterium]